MSHPRSQKPPLSGTLSRNRSDWLRVGIDPYPELRRLMAPRLPVMPQAPKK